MCLLKTKIPKELKTPFSGETLSVLLMECHASDHQMLFCNTPVLLVTSGMSYHAIAHQVIYNKFYGFEIFFFTIGRFFSYTLSYFFLSWHPWASSSASKSAELHAVVRNTVPAQMSVWITAIHRLKVSKMFLYLNMSNIINYLWWKV